MKTGTKIEVYVWDEARKGHRMSAATIVRSGKYSGWYVVRAEDGRQATIQVSQFRVAAEPRTRGDRQMDDSLMHSFELGWMEGNVRSALIDLKHGRTEDAVKTLTRALDEDARKAAFERSRAPAA